MRPSVLMELIVGVAGLLLLWHVAGWEIAAAVTLLMWSQNLHDLNVK